MLSGVAKGSRNVLLEPAGSQVPPWTHLVAQHRLLTSNISRDWDDILNSIQTPESLAGDVSLLTGELRSMCSLSEMIDKQLTSTTNDLERLVNEDDREGRYVNRFLAVKSFQRSDASKRFSASETRSVVWCRRTIDLSLKLHGSADLQPCAWLYRNQVDGLQYRFLDLYNFTRDRFRGLWQDLTIQHAPAHQGTIEVYEISCRLLLLAEELLCEDSEFNAVQNGNLLSTCLDKLMVSYSAARAVDKSQMRISVALKNCLTPESIEELKDIIAYRSPHEAEFWAYRILLCLSSQSSSTAIHVAHRVPFSLKQNPWIQLAMKSVRAFNDGVIIRYFKYTRQAPPLMAALMAKYTDLARVRFLTVLGSEALRKQSSRIPLSTFVKLFNTDSPNTLTSFCKNAGLILQDSSDSTANAYVDVAECSIYDSHTPHKLRLRRNPNPQVRELLARIDRLTLLDPPVSVIVPDRVVEVTQVPILLESSPGENSNIPLTVSQQSPEITVEDVLPPQIIVEEVAILPQKRTTLLEQEGKKIVKLVETQMTDRELLQQELMSALDATLLQEFCAKQYTISCACLLEYSCEGAVHKLMQCLPHTSVSDLPEPTLTIYRLKIRGPARSITASIVDAILIGHSATPGLLKMWSESEAFAEVNFGRDKTTEFNVSSECVRMSLWVQSRGHTRGSIGILYSSDRESIVNNPDSQTSSSCKTREQVPSLIYCPNERIRIQAHRIDGANPWRVDVAVGTMIMEKALERLEQWVRLHPECHTIALLWTIECKTTADFKMISRAMDAAVQQCIFSCSWLKLLHALLPIGSSSVIAAARPGEKLLCGVNHAAVTDQLYRLGRYYLSMQKNEFLPNCLNSFSPESKHTAEAIGKSKSSGVWTQWDCLPTPTLPFLLLNLWKREMETATLDTSVVSMVDRLDTGIRRFLLCPYWRQCHSERPKILQHLQFDAHDETQINACRKILKKIRKACIAYIHSNSDITKARECENAKATLKIQSYGGDLNSATEKLYLARKYVREVVTQSIAATEARVGQNLMRHSYVLPLPLQLWTVVNSCAPVWGGRIVPPGFYS